MMQIKETFKLDIKIFQKILLCMKYCIFLHSWPKKQLQNQFTSNYFKVQIMLQTNDIHQTYFISVSKVVGGNEKRNLYIKLLRFNNWIKRRKDRCKYIQFSVIYTTPVATILNILIHFLTKKFFHIFPRLHAYYY